MPLLDVSDILSDPDFSECLTCARNAQTVGTNGLAVNTPTTTQFTGVVTSDTGNVLQRMAEGSYVRGSILIHSQFALSAGASGQDADIVTWRGRQFTVVDVNDYSTYGVGFTCAHCEPLALSGS